MYLVNIALPESFPGSTRETAVILLTSYIHVRGYNLTHKVSSSALNMGTKQTCITPSRSLKNQNVKTLLPS